MTTRTKRGVSGARGSGYWKARRIALHGHHLVIGLEGRQPVRVSLSDLGIGLQPKIVRARLIGFGSAFEIERSDGARQDVALDLVRYHVDPDYRAEQQAHRGTLAQQVGARIRLLRLARGQTAAETARRLGMARQNYSRIEAGKHPPSFDVLVRLADILAASLDSLAGRRVPKPGEVPAAA